MAQQAQSQAKDHILEIIKNEIEKFQSVVTVEKVGTVIEVGDGIARVAGLADIKAAEMLDFGNSVYGVALNLEEDSVGCVLLSHGTTVHEGDLVKGTGRILSVPVGEQLVGRVVNPLGVALDGRTEIKSNTYYPVEKIAPGV